MRTLNLGKFIRPRKFNYSTSLGSICWPLNNENVSHHFLTPVTEVSVITQWKFCKGEF